MTSAISNNLALTAEQGTWAGIDGEWQRLFGDFSRDGLSIEWHDFQTAGRFDWARSFHDESIEICLNLVGRGRVQQRSKSIALRERAVAFYAPHKAVTKAEREAGERHCFITIELSRDWLEERLAGDVDQLRTEVRRFLGGHCAGMAVASSMNPAQQALFGALRKPPVPPAARRMWYEGKVYEILAHHFFRPGGEEPEFFCVRHKRLACDRVARVQRLLRENLCEPPTLDELAREVGCSAFHLSRCFSQETGKTIPQFLRQIRMERAADLLLTGDYNITEVALEVGYSSISHFSRAFCETTGYCPALYTSMMRSRLSSRG